MMKKIILIVLIYFLSPSLSREKKPFVRVHKFRYPTLFRDHVFDTLSEKGKEMFFAVEIHPSCVAKKGQCIPRAQCVGMEMLYISRICYKRDLVCCYDNTIRFPEVGNEYFTTTGATTAIVKKISTSVTKPSSTTEKENDTLTTNSTQSTGQNDTSSIDTTTSTTISTTTNTTPNGTATSTTISTTTNTTPNGTATSTTISTTPNGTAST